jgi:hypothetical protein
VPLDKAEGHPTVEIMIGRVSGKVPRGRHKVSGHGFSRAVKGGRRSGFNLLGVLGRSKISPAGVEVVEKPHSVLVDGPAGAEADRF